MERLKKNKGRSKHGLISRVLMIVFSIIFVSACGRVSNHETDAESSQASSIEERELIASYEDDYVPAFIEKSGDKWFVIYRTYGENDYFFAAGDSPDTRDVKYEGSGQIKSQSCLQTAGTLHGPSVLMRSV